MEELYKQLQTAFKHYRQLIVLLGNYQKIDKSPQNAYKLLELLKRLKQIATALDMDTLLKEFQSELETQMMLCKQLQEENQRSFTQALSQRLTSLGFELQGQLPKLYCGLYSICVEFSSGGLVRINWGPEPVATVKIDVESIANQIMKFQQHLKRQQLCDGEIVHEAYKRVIQYSGKSYGEKVNIMEVFAQVLLLIQPKSFWINPSRNHFCEYSKAAFGYELYELMKAGKLKNLMLYTATFDTTKDKTQAIFIPQSQTSGARYSYISFSK